MTSGVVPSGPAAPRRAPWGSAGPSYAGPMSASGSAREAIVRAAYDSFLDVGYARTTYQRIADLSGFERTLVQYHAPKKDDLAQQFLAQVLAAVEAAVVEHGLGRRDEPISFRYALAQLYFASLGSASLRRFTLDVLDSRAVLEHVLLDDVEWNLALVQPQTGVDRQRVVDDTVMGVGGTYELFRYRLRHDQEVAPADLARRVLAASLRHELAGRPLVEADLDAHTLDGARLDRAVAAVIGALRGTTQD